MRCDGWAYFFTFKKYYRTFGNYILRNNFFLQMPRWWSLGSCDPTPINAAKFPFTNELWWALIHSIVDSPWSHINLLTFTSLPTFSACHAHHLFTFTSLSTFGACHASHLSTTFASLPIFNTYHVNLLSPYLPSPPYLSLMFLMLATYPFIYPHFYTYIV